MSSSQSLPVTPQKQLTSSILRSALNSPEFDTLHCSPETRSELISRKRKANQVLSEDSPTTTTSFLPWRLSVVDSSLRLIETQKRALSENQNVSTTFANTTKQNSEIIIELHEKEQNLLNEKAILLSNNKILEQDLNDRKVENMSSADWERIYINELRMSLENASTANMKRPGQKTPRLERKAFKLKVDNYLGTLDVSETGDKRLFCNILGYWLPTDAMKCAHIVPFSWNTKDMAHIFGSDEPPLTSNRNGLSMQKKIEEGFDNCWIAIVPAETVETTPTEWKVVVLNSTVENKEFFTDQFNITDKKRWLWRDIHGRKLKFLNDNRPARRFLYMRYTLAWLHAEEQSWPGFKQKVPPGELWASPNKPDGYLRKSVLLSLDKMTGDRLPKALVDAGSFVDEDSSSKTYDEVAGIRFTEHIQCHLGGARDDKEEENDIDDEDEDSKIQ